jgi:hypothetical protein
MKGILSPAGADGEYANRGGGASASGEREARTTTGEVVRALESIALRHFAATD